MYTCKGIQNQRKRSICYNETSLPKKILILIKPYNILSQALLDRTPTDIHIMYESFTVHILTMYNQYVNIQDGRYTLYHYQNYVGRSVHRKATGLYCIMKHLYHTKCKI